MDAGNEPRLWEEFVMWTQQDGFDYELTGARMLGHDIAQQLNAQAGSRVATIVASQVRLDEPGVLPNEMNPYHPEKAVSQLLALLRGMNNGA